MPRISEMKSSKFLKKEDVGRGVLVTIAAVRQHDVAAEGAGQELKWCMEFREVDKPLVLNITNMNLMQSITGSDNSDDWVGKAIVIYDDPTIQFQGKLTGGIRIRAPKPGSVPTPPQQLPDPMDNSDIPF